MTHPDDDALAALALGEPAPSGARRARARLPVVLRRPGHAARHDDDAARPGARAGRATRLGVGRRRGRARPRARHRRARPVPTAGTDDAPASAVREPADDLADRRAARGERRRFPLAWVAGAAAAGLVIGVVGARAVDDDQGAPVVTVAQHEPGHPRHPAGQGHGRRRAPRRPARPRREHPADRPRRRLPRGVADQQGPQADGVGGRARARARATSRSRSRRSCSTRATSSSTSPARASTTRPSTPGDSVVRGTLAT